MRPRRLILEGFRSYAEETTIDFTGLPAVAIVGPNGAGKTTIVEAIRFALYGEGRRGPRPDLYVSDAGATDCRVTFEFDLDGDQYRVVRSRSIGTNAKTLLELNAHRPSGSWGEEDWYAIAAGGVRENQEAIIRLLGMDHDVWLASSFLAQGDASAWTNQSPAERKQTLARLLGIGFYERIAESARATERELAGRQSAEQLRIEQLEDVVAGETAARQRLREATDREAATQRQLQDLAGAMAAARAEFETARTRTAAIVDLRVRLGTERERQSIEVARLVAEYGRARAEHDQLEHEALGASDQVARLQDQASRLTDHEAAAVAAELATDARQRDADDARAAAEAKATDAAIAAQRASGASLGIPDLAEKIRLLQRPDPVCPACGQEVTEEHRARELAAAERVRRQLQAEANDLQRQHQALDGDAHRYRLDATEHAKVAARSRAEAAEHRLGAERAAGAAERLTEERDRLESLRARTLEKARHAAELASRADEARAEFLRIDAAAAEQLAGVEDLDKAVRDAQSALHALEIDQDTARRWLTDAAGELGRATEALEVLERAKTELTATRARHDDVARERHQYGTYALAAGKDGAIALIVENAVPQIVTEANRLLERIDERLSVSIESLRATKAGELRETLDIIVTLGTTERALEDLSGGERQTVDLALRIGLARLLAHRAGRPIQTLILDEAFVAFDAGRRQRAVEVLHLLAEEFPSLMLVTHDADLAAVFPARIVVSNEGGSSRVEILEAVAA